MGRREKVVAAEPNTIESLGATLRRARQQKSISLTDLAQRLGYSKSHLSVVETGRVWPSRELLQAYEEALDLQSSSLVQLAESLAPLRRSRASAPYVGASIETLLRRVARGVGERIRPEGRERGRTSPPGNGTATRETQTAIEWACNLVDWAANHPPVPPREEIIVVGFSAADVIPTLTDSGAPFKAALQGALSNGWNVSQLRWLDSSEEYRLSLFVGMLDFYGFRGTYRPFILPTTKGLGTPPYGLVAVPGYGALLLLPTRTDRVGHYAVYAALSFSDPETTAILWENGAALRDLGQSLATTYERPLDWRSARTPREEWARFSEAETRTIIQPGDRLLVRDGIGSPGLLADDRLESDLAREKEDPAWEPFLRTLQSDRRLQQTAFRDQARVHLYRELLTKRGLERFADGVPSPLDASIPSLSSDQRAAWLRTLAALLLNSPQYEIGLLDEVPDWLAPGGGWLVKGTSADGFVHFETLARHDGAPAQLLIEIRDAILTQGMRDYFFALWERVPLANRTKEAVAEYLQQLAQRAESAR
ncbi:MAG: helix-turn-helix transcriptional regulator [Chloroflexota bacterium]|nr:helix-turn-helix domain-containing protein [Dehalococcoidia bacterium]MDW8254104.1 helix-turn-helix transcriptional regulator [Chloroflexota bacterium]